MGVEVARGCVGVCVGVGVSASGYGPAESTLRFATNLGSFVSITTTFLLSEEMPTLFNTVKSLKS